MSATLCAKNSIALAGRKVSGVRRARVAAARPMTVSVKAINEFGDAQFMAATVEAFPEKMIANPEEARTLFDNGYIFLDVRPQLEYDSIGSVKGSVHIPFVTAKKRFEDGKMIVDLEDNMQFEAQVEKRFPDKSQTMMVADSNGQKYLMEVLEILDDMGYTNLVAVKGGFMNWYKHWDNKLNRRRHAEFKENNDTYDPNFDGDSCGIHASGAGFQNGDATSGDFWQNGLY